MNKISPILQAMNSGAQVVSSEPNAIAALGSITLIAVTALGALSMRAPYIVDMQSPSTLVRGSSYQFFTSHRSASIQPGKVFDLSSPTTFAYSPRLTRNLYGKK